MKNQIYVWLSVLTKKKWIAPQDVIGEVTSSYIEISTI